MIPRFRVLALALMALCLLSAPASRGAFAASPVYTVVPIEADGVPVREFRDSSGVVFGYAWSGLAHPDLHKLLGPYGEEYRKGLERNPRRAGHRSNHSFTTDHMVVQKWGHMRKLQGRAFFPALLPAGVSTDVIK